METAVAKCHQNLLTTPGRKLASRQISIMIIFVVICAVITYFNWGLLYAYSLLVGGVVVIVPNIIFAYKAFKYAGASASRKVIESFYSGVKLKMLYTTLLFALVFKFLVISPLIFLSTYCVVVFLTLLLPVFLTER
ncbi:MAG: ATP synthase protein I [Cognaticolwellia sp.]